MSSLSDALAEKAGKVLDSIGRDIFDSKPRQTEEFRDARLTCVTYERITFVGQPQGERPAIFFVIKVQVGDDCVTVRALVGNPPLYSSHV